jgi:hypothetical protein
LDFRSVGSRFVKLDADNGKPIGGGVLVNFYDDSVAVEDLCVDLSNGEIVVIEAVRPKFKKISNLVKEGVSIPPLALAVEDDEKAWHYYLLPGSTDYSLAMANDLVVRAAKRWADEGRKWPFAVSV